MSSDILPKLLAIIRSTDDASLHRYTLMAVSNLAAFAGNQLHLLASGAVSNLLQTLVVPAARYDKEKSRWLQDHNRYKAAALSNLTRSPENSHLATSANISVYLLTSVHDTLYLCFESTMSPQDVLNGLTTADYLLSAAAHIATDSHQARRMVLLGYLDVAKLVMSHSSRVPKSLFELLCKMIFNLSASHELSELVDSDSALQSEVFTCLVHAIELTSASAVLTGTSAVGGESEQWKSFPEFSAIDFGGGTSIAEDGVMNSHSYALKALINFSARKGVVLPEDLLSRVYRVLISLLGSGERAHQVHSLLALINLAKSAASKELLVKQGALTYLLYCASSADVELQRYGLVVLANLASESDYNRRELISRDILAVLRQMATSTSIPVECHEVLAMLLFNLCNSSDEGVSEYIGARHGIEALYVLTTSLDANTQYLGIDALAMLLQNKRNQTYAVDSNILGYLPLVGFSVHVETAKQVARCIKHLSESNEESRRLLIVQACSHALNHMLASSEDQKVLEYAAAALERITETLSTHPYVVSSGASESVFRLLSEGNELEVQRQAIHAVSNLLSSSTYRDSTFAKRLPLLIDRAFMSDTYYCYQMALALTKLSTHATFHDSMVATGGIKALMHLIQIDDVPTQVLALTLLNEIAMHRKYQLLFQDDSGVAKIIYLSKSSNKVVQNIALSVLRLLAQTDELRELIILNHVDLAPGEPIQGARLDREMTQSLVRYTLNQLNLSLQSSNEEVAAPSSSKSGVPAELSNVASTNLKNITDGITGRLRLQLECCGLFANLSENSSHAALMIEEGLGSTLASLALACTDLDLQATIVRTYANILRDDRWHVRLYSEHAMSALTKLLDTQAFADITQYFMANALRHLAFDPQVRLNIAVDQCLQPYLTMASSSSAVYRLAAADSLASITLSEGAVAALVGQNCIGYLLSLAYDTDIAVVRQAIFALANIAESVRFHSQLISAGIMKLLLALNQSALTRDASIAHSLSRIASTLGQTDFVKEDAVRAKILANMLSYVNSRDIERQRYTALALCNICCWDASPPKAELIEQGAFKPMLFLARFPDGEVMKYSALGFAGLYYGASGTVKQSAVDTRFIRALMDLLRNPEKQMVIVGLLAANAVCLGDDVDILAAFLLVDDGLSSFLDILRSVAPGLTSQGPDKVLSTQEIKQERLVRLMESSQQYDEPENYTGDLDMAVADAAGGQSYLATEKWELIFLSLYALGSLCENEEIRQRYMEMDALDIALGFRHQPHLKIKRALGYFVAVVAQSKVNHNYLYESGALQFLVDSTQFEDLECQECALFALSHMADNIQYQVLLASLGLVRILVSIIASNQDPKHYATVCLMKLASNFENHITIAEQGGISSLVTLSKHEKRFLDLQYEAALSAGTLAGQAIRILPSMSEATMPLGSSSPTHRRLLEKAGRSKLAATTGIPQPPDPSMWRGSGNQSSDSPPAPDRADEDGFARTV